MPALPSVATCTVKPSAISLEPDIFRRTRHRTRIPAAIRSASARVKSPEITADALIGLLKKPWWVGPLIAGVSYNHYHSDKPAEPAAVSGYEVAHNRGNLPRNGRVVVVAS